MTRQRTLILTRIESSDWGRQDVDHRRTGKFRYWLMVPFYSCLFMVDMFIKTLLGLVVFLKQTLPKLESALKSVLKEQ